MRKNIVIPDDLNRRARTEARRRGVSQSRLIVAALERELASRDPIQKWAGAIATGRSDSSVRVDQIYDDRD